MEDYKKLLTDLYQLHDPERIKQIDYFLERYKGKERQFFISQQAKYKSKKLVSDSKKIIEEALERIKTQSEVGKTEPADKDQSKHTEEIVVPPVEKEIEKVIEEEIEEVKEIEKEVENETELEKEVEKTPEAETFQPIIPLEETQGSPAEEVPPPIVVKPIYRKPPVEKDKSKRKKFYLIFFGIVALVMLIILIIFIIFYYVPINKQTKINTEKNQTTIIKEQSVTDDQTTEPELTTESTPPPGTAKIESGSLKLPTYFVACSAVKNESFALVKVKELQEKGFDAKYFWIPDFIPYGHPYFKVVIGPFETRRDAMRTLTPVQERAEFDAYVFELK